VPTQSQTVSLAEIQNAFSAIAGKNKIIFAFSREADFREHSHLCWETIKAHPQGKPLALSYFLARYFSAQGIAHDSVCAERMTQEHADLFAQSEQFAQNCFNENGEYFPQHEGLPLGHCMEYPLFNFFQGVFKAAVDLEVYLQREKPEAVIYFNPGSDCGGHVEGNIDFNVYENLLPFLCRKAGIDVYDIRLPVRDSTARPGWFSALWAKGPAISVLGQSLRMPTILYQTVKYVFLLGKNLTTLWTRPAGKPQIVFAGPTSFNYLGSHLIENLLASEEFNVSVWDGESKQSEVFCIVPQLSFAYWVEKLKAKSLREYFAERFEEDKDKLRRNTVFAGIPLLDLFPVFFEDVYLRWFPDLVAHARLLRRALVRRKAGVFLSHSDHALFERVGLWVARSLSIPTVYFQHGIEGQPANTILGYPSSADRLFVWGEADRRFKLAKGVDADRIRVVGFPGAPLRPASATRDSSLDRPGTFVFICNTGGQFRCDNRMTFFDNENQIRLVLRVMKSFPAKTLLIKTRFHDAQTEVYRRLIEQEKVSNVKITDMNIGRLLRDCDLYFNVFSTAGLEAVALNKPGIQFLFPYDNKQPLIDGTGTRHIPFAEFGAALGLAEPDDGKLIELIKSIYTSPEVGERLARGRDRFLKEYAGFGGGDPAERFCLELKECLQDSKNRFAPRPEEEEP
jgi:hypothetical protein